MAPIKIEIGLFHEDQSVISDLLLTRSIAMADYFVFVFDVTRAETFGKLQDIHDLIWRTKSFEFFAPCIICGWEERY